MTFSDIKKRIASNIGYVNATGGILTGKDITETDIGNWVNDRYLDDLVSNMANQYPEDYEQVAKANFYKATGTADASSTSTTLVSSVAMFNNSMVGDTVYNSTDSASRIIDAYTNPTTITVDSAVDDDWDSDAIYVLGHEFVLWGDATDTIVVRRVGVKYDSTSKYFITCRQKDQNKLFETGNETYSEVSPVWYPTTVDVNDNPTDAIGILPEPESNIDNGIEFTYVELPPSLSVGANVPRLPLGSHSILVLGGTSDAYRKLRHFDKADELEAKYQLAKREMVANYSLTRAAGPVTIYPPRRVKRMLDRTR